jgi:hypothetical protein
MGWALKSLASTSGNWSARSLICSSANAGIRSTETRSLWDFSACQGPVTEATVDKLLEPDWKSCSTEIPHPLTKTNVLSTIHFLRVVNFHKPYFRRATLAGASMKSTMAFAFSSGIVLGRLSSLSFCSSSFLQLRKQPRRPGQRQPSAAERLEASHPCVLDWKMEGFSFHIGKDAAAAFLLPQYNRLVPQTTHFGQSDHPPSATPHLF